MKKNGKFLLRPSGEERSFHDLFIQVANVGAGRPVRANGESVGAWTPALLEEALNKVETVPGGVSRRTVQRWFEGKPIKVSNNNLNRLAVIFGCGDPEEIHAWRIELRRANSATQANAEAPELLSNVVSKRSSCGGLILV